MIRASPYFRYSAFGLEIESALALPELRRSQRGSVGDADVAVRLGALPPPDVELRTLGKQLRFGPEEVRLELDGFARFAIRGGREILVDPCKGAKSADIRVYLLGSAFAILLHQRGQLPLHASAIVANDRAILFMGASGAGKSTLAQHFHDRGYAMISDDVSVIDGSSGDMIGVWPSVTRLKLWRASLDFAGRSAAGLDRVHYADDKFHLPAERLCEYRSWPLAAIYVLDREAPELAEFLRLRGRDKISALFSHTFRGVVTEPMGLSADHLRQCLAVARDTPVFVLGRQWGLDAFGAEADRLESHFLEVTATSRRPDDEHAIKTG